MTVQLHTIDLSSDRGVVSVKLTSRDGRAWNFDLPSIDAAAFGRSLVNHADVPRRRKRAA